ncbi:hypothetical protein SAMN00768000_3588 [Sulfobacillus thermosulfidooxidans DSM 9293]|uniref:Uncharacterized protein n=2 Tax=Sulfobacillus thermosulfidooxidans TaxID=28034 RepID=A0A1W1WP62_SULTA|nr:hypothetical protein SAMN00768000_3588 [Sulfobacillus thermosulfidooxidans DSM 9293]
MESGFPPHTRGWTSTLDELPDNLRLGATLRLWQQHIAPQLPPHVFPATLQSLILLADRLPWAVEQADRARAYRFITAPVSEDILPYWQDVITRNTLLKPPPPHPQTQCVTAEDLRRAEQALHAADLYVWLARHQLLLSRSAQWYTVHKALCGISAIGFS